MRAGDRECARRPMGWKNVVDLIQVAHEEMGAVAGVAPSHTFETRIPFAAR